MQIENDNDIRQIKFDYIQRKIADQKHNREQQQKILKVKVLLLLYENAVA
jgi:hypothetical protein